MKKISLGFDGHKVETPTKQDTKKTWKGAAASSNKK